MRPICRRFLLAVAGAALFAVSVPTIAAEEQVSSLAIRPEPASSSADEPPAMPTDVQPSALPAESPPPAAPAADSQPPKLPVAKLPFRRSNISATTVMRAIPEPQVTNQTRQALGFYGGNPARQTLSQFPHRTPIQAGPPQPIRQQIKPFNAVYREPTISPYLNLYREEDDTQSAPNYYAFVRPQLEQNDANRLQQGEIQRLTRQLQSRSPTMAAPRYQPTGTPGASTAGVTSAQSAAVPLQTLRLTVITPFTQTWIESSLAVQRPTGSGLPVVLET